MNYSDNTQSTDAPPQPSRRMLLAAIASAPLAAGLPSGAGAATPAGKSNGKVAIVTGSY